MHNRSYVKSLRLAGFGFAALLLISCGQTEEDTGACAAANSIVAEPSYSSLWSNVFSSSCGSCHGVSTNSNTSGGPDLRSKTAFHNALVGRSLNDYPTWTTAQVNRSGCLSIPLIRAGSAADSLVVGVLDASILPSTCTVKSHIDSPQNVCISSGSLASLKKWIDNGAAQ